jgi:hypothetical protein
MAEREGRPPFIPNKKVWPSKRAFADEKRVFVGGNAPAGIETRQLLK